MGSCLLLFLLNHAQFSAFLLYLGHVQLHEVDCAQATITYVVPFQKYVRALVLSVCIHKSSGTDKPCKLETTFKLQYQTCKVANNLISQIYDL